jgi:dephospho-CoA kinase
MLKVALTGNVASGKSSVASIWFHAGVPVIRADDLAREVVAPGSLGLERVRDLFGPEVLDADGALDRARLRDRVFRDSADRERLEAILHPLIRARREEWLSAREEEGVNLAVAEIPLLYEVGLEAEFDVVVVVDAGVALRHKRLVEDRGIDGEEATRIMQAQMPSSDKLERADYVLDNQGTLEDLEIRALALLDLLQARARRGSGR